MLILVRTTPARRNSVRCTTVVFSLLCSAAVMPMGYLDGTMVEKVHLFAQFAGIYDHCTVHNQLGPQHCHDRVDEAGLAAVEDRDLIS